MEFMTRERQRAYDFDDGKEAGIIIGIKQKAIEDAKCFYENGVSIEIIAKSLKMTIEEVEKIVNEPVHTC